MQSMHVGIKCTSHCKPRTNTRWDKAQQFLINRTTLLGTCLTLLVWANCIFDHLQIKWRGVC